MPYVSNISSSVPPDSRRGFLRLSRVLPTSRVFTSGYINPETILHFFNVNRVQYTVVKEILFWPSCLKDALCIKYIKFSTPRFASWFPTLISCSPNLPRVYIRLYKPGNHFTFLQCKPGAIHGRKRNFILTFLLEGCPMYQIYQVQYLQIHKAGFWGHKIIK